MSRSLPKVRHLRRAGARAGDGRLALLVDADSRAILERVTLDWMPSDVFEPALFREVVARSAQAEDFVMRDFGRRIA